MHQNLKKLIHYLGDGEFHSGAWLGQRLGVARHVIWKLVYQLSAFGIPIESMAGKGYRTPMALDFFSVKRIKQHLSNHSLKNLKKIEIFDSIDSTNSYLMQQAVAHSEDIRVCLAEQQLHGRGRLGRVWQSPFGANIYLSLLFPFKKDASALVGLSLVIAIAVVDVLSDLGIVQDIGLKWPNDVLWKHRKLAGILIETSGEAYGSHCAVIGVGLNVHMSESQAKAITQPWVDLYTIGAILDRNKIAGLLIDRCLKYLFVFQQTGLSPFLKRWKQLDVTRNQPVTITSPSGTHKGIAHGVDNQGRLILEDHAGQERAFSVGEICSASFAHYCETF